MMGYYDLVLGLIPVSLFGIAGFLYGVGLGLTVSIALAAVVSVGVVMHALFFRAPTAPPRKEGPSIQAAD